MTTLLELAYFTTLNHHLQFELAYFKQKTLLELITFFILKFFFKQEINKVVDSSFLSLNDIPLKKPIPSS